MSTLTLLLSSTLIFAPEAPAEPPDNDADADEAALVGSDEDASYFSFGEDEVNGSVLRDDGTLIPWRRPHHHGSLITLRPHFMRELVNLALDL